MADSGATALTVPEPVSLVDPMRPAAATQEVVVLDYGGQYSQLIARRVRECGVFSELVPHHVGAEEVARRRPMGVILSGGPASVYADGAPALDPALLELGVPVLGICYGMQLLARELGGRVEGAEVGEFGRSELRVSEQGRLLAGTPAEQTCWMSHRDTVFSPPPGFTALASSTASPVAAFESLERQVYGIQFHPEVVHTPYGQAGLDRLPARRVRLRAVVEPAVGDRGADRADPRPGRRRSRHLRPLGRRRLERRRAARCTGRSATG